MARVDVAKIYAEEMEKMRREKLGLPPEDPPQRAFSPIESRLTEALCGCAEAAGVTVALFARGGTLDPKRLYIAPEMESEIFGVEESSDALLIHLHREVNILTYRADILLTTGFGMLAIECDGHDFHDRTKQQAAYDRARDRELLLLGVSTIRYTGSEIHHSAERCAHEAFAILKAIEERGFLQFEGLEARCDRETRKRGPRAPRPPTTEQI